MALGLRPQQITLIHPQSPAKHMERVLGVFRKKLPHFSEKASVGNFSIWCLRLRLLF